MGYPFSGLIERLLYGLTVAQKTNFHDILKLFPTVVFIEVKTEEILTRKDTSERIYVDYSINF
jgi:hypothetical protein